MRPPARSPLPPLSSSDQALLVLGLSLASQRSGVVAGHARALAAKLGVLDAYLRARPAPPPGGG